jgi:hypothetical protein
MTDFADVLLPLSARLPLPQPARSRVLLEIAADLEDMYRHYRAAGLSEADARSKAVDAFDLSDQALADLVQVHSTTFRKLLDRLSAQAQSRWERALLLLVALAVAFVALRLYLSGPVIADAGWMVWPPLLCAMAGLLLGLAKAYQVFIKQDHEPLRARRGVDAVAVLAITQCLLGFLGAYVGLYLAAWRIAGDVRNAFVYLFDWLLSGAALLSASLSGALLTAMIWFVLAKRVAVIADAEAMQLLATARAAKSVERAKPARDR